MMGLVGVVLIHFIVHVNLDLQGKSAMVRCMASVKAHIIYTNLCIVFSFFLFFFLNRRSYN